MRRGGGRRPAPPGCVTDRPEWAWSSRGEPGEGPLLPARVPRRPGGCPRCPHRLRLDDGGPQHEQWVLQPGGGPGGLLLHCEDHLLQECAEQASFEGTLHNRGQETFRGALGRITSGVSGGSVAPGKQAAPAVTRVAGQLPGVPSCTELHRPEVGSRALQGPPAPTILFPALCSAFPVARPFQNGSLGFAATLDSWFGRMLTCTWESDGATVSFFLSFFLSPPQI